MQPPGSPAAAVSQALQSGGARLLLLLLLFEGPEHSTADGWERCPRLPKVQSCRPSCGPGAAFPCTLAICLVNLCFVRELRLTRMKGNAASLSTFHLPRSSCSCSLAAVELQPWGWDLPSVWQGCSCCSTAS